jgi:hypothetical protein
VSVEARFPGILRRYGGRGARASSGVAFGWLGKVLAEWFSSETLAGLASRSGRRERVADAEAGYPAELRGGSSCEAWVGNGDFA